MVELFEWINEPGDQKDGYIDLEISKIIRYDRVVHFDRRFWDLWRTSEITPLENLYFCQISWTSIVILGDTARDKWKFST